MNNLGNVHASGEGMNNDMRSTAMYAPSNNTGLRVEDAVVMQRGSNSHLLSIKKRDNSFDLRSIGSSTAGGGSRRKKNRSSNNNLSSNQPNYHVNQASVIAGHVGSGIGSPRNLADATDEYETDSGIMQPVYQLPPPPILPRNIPQRPGNMYQSNSNYSMNRYGEIQIPIQRLDQDQQQQQFPRNHSTQFHYYNNSNQMNNNRKSNNNLISDYSDSRVAYRLASTEKL